MTRLVHNLLRLPKRLARSTFRWTNPVYRLQRQANKAVRTWLSQERIEQLNAIPGTSSDREGRLLAFLVSQSPAGGCVVEIGAFKGKTAAWLIEAAQHRCDKPAVVSIDPHLGYWDGTQQISSWDVFSQTVDRFQLVQRGLEVRRAFSHDVGKTWTRPISFLWVDGSHEYQDVVNDIEDFVPHVLPGGWIVFDDVHGCQCPGVWQAIAERMVGRVGFRRVGALKHFELFQRLTSNPAH